MPSSLSLTWLKILVCRCAMASVDLMDDWEVGYEPGAGDFEEDFEPGPEPDEDEWWRNILPTDEDAQRHADAFLQEQNEDMIPPHDEPPHEAVGCENGNGSQNVSALADSDVEGQPCTWDPYTVEVLTDESSPVTTPSPKHKRRFSDTFMETPGSGSSSDTFVKRRKLTGKQPPPNQRLQLPLQEEMMSDKTFEELSSLARQKTGVEKVRDLFMRHRRPLLRQQNTGLNHSELTNTIRKEWYDIGRLC